MSASLEQVSVFVSSLEDVTHRLSQHFDSPQFVQINGAPEFRYNQKNDLLLSFLKCIRSISSLNASVILISHGYFQEVGALCRGIDEFCEDVFYLATPLGEDGNYSADQIRLVKEFFQEEFPEDPGPLMQSQPRHRVSRDKVRAGISKIEGMPINSHDANQIHRSIDRSFSGYVHGAYVHIMEMYAGPALNQCKFQTSGMHTASRINVFTDTLANYAYRLALMVEIVARRCEDQDASEELKQLRAKFEEATGVGAGDAEKHLRQTKKRHET